MTLIKKLADNRDSGSLAARLRRKRFGLFRSLIESVPRPLSILDAGGTPGFWHVMGFTEADDVAITLLNLRPFPEAGKGFSSVVGDATRMDQFADGEFDVVFSNSVIEHVGTFDDQRRMAAEVQRVGKRYFVQTPNRYFPIEPHFLFPLFQFYPVALQTWLVQHFNLGWSKKVPDRQRAYEKVTQIRLLTKREMIELFPDAQIYEEKFFGLTKSYIFYGGW